MEGLINLDENGDFNDPERRTVYGELIYRVTPENADEVEDNIIAEMINLRNEGDGPFMLMVFTFNQVNLRAKNFLVRYSNQNLHALMETVRDPREAWNQYRDRIEEIGSDTAAAMESLTPHRKYTDDAQIWQLCHIGLYHPNFGVNLTRQQRGIIFADFPELLQFRRPENNNRVGRFMGFVFDFQKYQKGLYDDDPKMQCECFYWKNWMQSGKELEEKYQIPWFASKTSLKEGNEGEDPVENEIYRIPCMLYALKGQIREADWEDLSRKGFIHGAGVKTTKVRKFLNEKGYQLIERGIKKGVDCVTTSTCKYPKKASNLIPIFVDFWENHWMHHYEDAFIKHLERGKRLGLIVPMSAYEFYQTYDNYAIDAMVKFDDKIFIKKTPSDTEFSEWDFEKPVYKSRQGFNILYFADFEATTNEKKHRPFLICAMSYMIKDGRWLNDHQFRAWGPDCAKEFLEHLMERFGSSKKRGPSVRVYFYNLKYDFTFLFPLLNDVNKIQKGNKIYSIKAVYKSFGKTLYVDFWDALPIFQTTLKNAVKNQLSEDERRSLNVQKEVFPYNMYTYDFFEEHSYPNKKWVDVEEAKPFFDEDQYEEFILNLKKTLPFVPSFSDFTTEEEWGYNLKYQSSMFEEGERDYHYRSLNGKNNRSEHIYWEKFDYIEYAIFYCMQDVRCLAAIMQKFSSLLKGKGVEGIYGVPPFSMDLTAYRTASSIGYDYFLQTVMFKKEDEEWVPRHDWYLPKCSLRALIQKTIRGGRVMCRDNQKYHYIAASEESFVQDYDAVSLYPTAMSKLWLTDGIPKFIKKEDGYSSAKFLELFAPPEAKPEEAKKFTYQDGCIHLIHLNTTVPRHFPLLCVKDPKTNLNNYRNFNDEDVDTWVNMIDLFNLIDFQKAEFTWDAAVVWSGERHYEIRESITNLFNFRLQNHCKVMKNGILERHEHPIQGVAKLMMNSIFGKSILKPTNTEKKIVEQNRWRKDNQNLWTVVDNWEEFFRSNMYRIKRINPLPGTGKTEVEIYKRDTSSSMNIFGSNVLAMARRIIGRVMALAEDVEKMFPELSPGLFYTDTDSMHIRGDLLELVEHAFFDIYGYEIKGENMGNFHLDFDPPSTFKKEEKTKGAKECWFIAKKVYADALVGSEGSIGYHLRMKGIPTDLLKFEYYEQIYNNEPFTFDLLQKGHISLYYDGGDVCSRRVMTRTIMTKEAREAIKKRKRSQSLIETEDESEEPDYNKLFPPGPELHQIEVIEDDNTRILPPSPPSEQEEIDETQIVDIE